MFIGVANGMAKRDFFLFRSRFSVIVCDSDTRTRCVATLIAEEATRYSRKSLVHSHTRRAANKNKNNKRYRNFNRPMHGKAKEKCTLD